MRILLITIAVAMSGMVATAQKLNIDTDAAEVAFEFVSDKAKGTVSGFKCEIEFDAKDIANSKMSGTVDVSTLSTGNNDRDVHLKSADFFDAEKFPVIKFESTSFETGQKETVMKGNLTIKDKTKPCSIKFTYNNGVFVGRTTIDASDYGVSPGKKDGTTNITFKIPLAD